jgi:hypothetical protein
MPYVVSAMRECPDCAFGQQEDSSGMLYACATCRGSAKIADRRAVATLEERHVFDAREWKSAGHDQPDGNLQFWHPALILARHTHEGHYRDREEQESADVLWLHDGTVSHGHLTYMMGEPGEPTYRLASFPARWPERVIPESGGTVTLPDGTVIEVEATNYALTAAFPGLDPKDTARVLHAYLDSEGQA